MAEEPSASDSPGTLSLETIRREPKPNTGGAMAEDYQLSHVGTVAMIIGAVVLVLGLVGVYLTI